MVGVVLVSFFSHIFIVYLFSGTAVVSVEIVIVPPDNLTPQSSLCSIGSASDISDAGEVKVVVLPSISTDVPVLNPKIFNSLRYDGSFEILPANDTFIHKSWFVGLYPAVIMLILSPCTGVTHVVPSRETSMVAPEPVHVMDTP